MARPFFPIALASVAAKREFVELDSQPSSFSGITIRPFPLNHPQGAVGYRIETGKTVIVYATDLEHGHPQLDKVLREHVAGADLLIYDAQYTPEEYLRYRGWGHSTWAEGARVARDAGARRLVLFHHDPSHDDGFLTRVLEEGRRDFPGLSMATEGSGDHFPLIRGADSQSAVRPLLPERFFLCAPSLPTGTERDESRSCSLRGRA